MLYYDIVKQCNNSLGPWNEMGAPSKGKGDSKIKAGLSVKNGYAVRRGVT